MPTKAHSTDAKIRTFEIFAGMQNVFFMFFLQILMEESMTHFVWKGLLAVVPPFS